MSDAAIVCEGLGKQYRIGERERYKALRDVLTDAATAPFRRVRNRLRRPPGEAKPIIWALQDVSFEIKRGEVVGVIGRNGAGKSTLLKILSRITEPTTGCARIYGRIGSLLEVGTGFHPELTGRENIYLNGAILGMKKAEIARKFDEIVAFAEVEKFIDTPVKRYSSGMYVRLAFAVAAHMETEILLVDEVLAVGDAQFQKKCLGKMGDVAKHGRTVLFVSHNMGTMRTLCSSAMYLKAGWLKQSGPTCAIIDTYSLESVSSDFPNGAVETRNFVIEGTAAYGNESGKPLLPLQPATFVVTVRSKHECPDLSLRLGIEDCEGHRLIGVDSWTIEDGIPCRPLEQKQIVLSMPSFPLTPGEYRARIALHSFARDFWDELPHVIPFKVHEGPIDGCRLFDRRVHGIVATRVKVSSLEGRI